MRLQFASLLLVATTVLADGVAIGNAIQKISASTAKLNNTVVGFHNGILGLADSVKLIVDSTSLLNDINAATKVADASAPLTVNESITIALATQSLVTDVINVITNTVNAKPKFDKLLIVSPVVLINLKLQKKASSDFVTAVINKTPDIVKPIAQSLVAPINPAFDAAISEYNPFD